MEGKFKSFIQAAASVTSEEDVIALRLMADPSDDEDEMGAVYNDILGYNPITYFDERKIVSILRRINEETSYHFDKSDEEDYTNIIMENIKTSKNNVIASSFLTGVLDYNSLSNSDKTKVVEIISDVLKVDQDFVEESIFDDEDDYDLDDEMDEDDE